MEYIIRLRPDMLPELLSRKAVALDAVTELEGRKDLPIRRGVTIAVHIRGRNPDAGRKVSFELITFDISIL
jgi:hypothetical protein